jgi:exoribonuclease R
MSIPGILECSNKYKFGITNHGTPLYIFYPLDESLPNAIVGYKHADPTKNYLILVEPYTTDRTNLVSVLGVCGDWEAERKAILYRYCPYRYKKVQSQDLSIPERLENETLREYIIDSENEWTTFNIDPEGCQDIDDCISIRGDEMAITITDVASVVEKGSDIDKEAFKRGQTFYSEKERHSMLPPYYESACSLVPGKYRNGISLVFKKGFQDAFLIESSIKNDKTYTYESFSKSSYVSDEINIESLMIYYNNFVAKLLKQYKKGIFRRQSVSESISVIDQSIPDEIKTALYNTSAEYCEFNEDLHHSSLNLDAYCHCTSPIRRYADIENQRCLKEILKSQTIIHLASPDIKHLNLKSKMAKKHDRDLFFLQKIRENKENTIIGIIVNESKVWIPEWKRFIKLLNAVESGKEVKIKYHYNRLEKSWKKRMVFKTC